MNASRFLLTLVGAGIIGTMALGLRAAQEPTKKDAPNVGVIKEKLQLEEQQLKEQFLQFQTSVLKLKQRLERSGKKEDADKAKNLDKVLDLIRDKTVTTKFERLADFLNKTNFNNVGDLGTAVTDAKQLADDLRAIISLLQQSSTASRLTDDRKKLEELIAAIGAAIKNQTITQIQTEQRKTDLEELQELQRKNNKEVKGILDKVDRYGKGAEAKEAGKGENKPGSKGDGKNGEAKGDGKGGENQGKAKEGDGADKNKPSEAKPGNGKGDPKKSGEGQQAEAKPGKGGEGAKEAGAKGDPKGGEGAGAKANPGGKEGDKKEGGAKGNEDKSGAKPSEAKPAQGDKKESGQPSESKPGKGGEGAKEAGAKGDPKGGKGGDSKPSESKPGGGKPSDSKPGDSKGGESAQGQSESKPGADQGGEKDQKPNQNNQPQDVTAGKKKIQDADYQQQQAQKELKDKKPEAAVPKQEQAVKDLEAAKKKLEDLLRQMREEELERLLAALQARCEKMLIMQMEVLVGTELVYAGVEKTIDKQPDRNHKIESNRQADKEKEIVVEASKAIEMLEAEGTAVAFPEVFQQLREDMKHVQRRLDITDVGQVTQAIEKDIIDTLKEMIEALKKAQQEANDKKNPKDGGKPPPPNPNADQKLLDQIAELKMIRSLQLRVNARTTTYGRMYPGEQAQEPNIRREVIQLGDRQERIFDITNRIAKGDNK